MGLEGSSSLPLPARISTRAVSQKPCVGGRKISKYQVEVKCGTPFTRKGKQHIGEPECDVLVGEMSHAREC